MAPMQPVPDCMVCRGMAGCKLAQEILDHPTMQGLALYGFKAVPRNKRMVIAIDKASGARVVECWLISDG